MSADPAKKEHYSYEHYRSDTVAEGFDALRFGGPIGEMVQHAQEVLLMAAFGPIQGRTILDVGTGTGRAALAFARAGAVVTGIDASDAMLAVARRAAEARKLTATFQLGDAHAIPFADRSFECAVSLRVIMHTPDWKQCVTELCRVAKWRVVVDFPSARSAAAIESRARQKQLARGEKVEAYRTLSEADVRAVIEAAGFRVIGVHKQFVLPINFHKLFNVTWLTSGVEAVLRAVGLLKVFGSPVTITAERIR
ncbi:MAG: class I SAM-dependent methyltransferase [Acidobacteria bacterium]|nr:MAG: class I SAM-dependent methyltransferase [Acidobacteriota bacterium]